MSNFIYEDGKMYLSADGDKYIASLLNGEEILEGAGEAADEDNTYFWARAGEFELKIGITYKSSYETEVEYFTDPWATVHHNVHSGYLTGFEEVFVYFEGEEIQPYDDLDCIYDYLGRLL